jgi:NAD(P)-dependent dehydrogenase (short-subunit alcohol dehydrogenase family)
VNRVGLNTYCPSGFNFHRLASSECPTAQTAVYRSRGEIIFVESLSRLGQHAVAFTVQRYGPLEIMVNNAVISAMINLTSYQKGGFCRLHEIDGKVFDQDMAINARGVWLGVKYAAAQFLEQSPHPSGDRGWIVNICSVMGLVASHGTASYCASKGAVLKLTKATALDYANDRIRVNCITPGYVDTVILEPIMAKSMGGQAEAQTARIRGLHPWGRMALPEDVARMAVFLTGSGASFCIGQAFVVDGGYTTQ